MIIINSIGLIFFSWWVLSSFLLPKTFLSPWWISFMRLISWIFATIRIRFWRFSHQIVKIGWHFVWQLRSKLEIFIIIVTLIRTAVNISIWIFPIWIRFIISSYNIKTLPFLFNMIYVILQKRDNVLILFSQRLPTIYITTMTLLFIGYTALDESSSLFRSNVVVAIFSNYLIE